MKRSTKVTISCLLVVLAIAVSLCLAFSLQLALLFSGYDTDNITYIEYRGLDANNEVISVFQTTKGNGSELALIEARKNWLGFWSITRQYATEADIGIHNTQLVWTYPSRVRRFAAEDVPIFERVYHYAYCGRDATALIEFTAGQIPENATVNIRQAGEYYLIHIITSSDSGGINLDVISMLSENGCIAE